MNKIVISLDFDVTLLGSKDNKALNFYNKFKDKFEFIILTRRYDDYHAHLWESNPSNKDLYQYLEENNLDKSKVFFQNFEYKYKWLKDSTVVVHIDDDSYEIDLVNNFTNTYAISCFHENLEEAILKYISEGVIL